MTRLAEFEAGWSEPPNEKHELGLLDNDRTVAVYFLKKHDMTVRFARRNRAEPIVELALGSEVRILPLAEFIHFWLTMIEVGRQADGAYLESLAELRRCVD